MSLLEEIEERRSRKSFLKKDGSPSPASVEVPEDILAELITAAQLSPSCFNNQPARFIVMTGADLERLHPALSRGNAWAKEAPVIIAIASHPDLDCRITGRDYFMLGVGLQLENLILQAVHRGLFAHPIAGFKEEMVKEVLGIPDEFRVPTLVIIGYPDPDEELEEKGRKPMGEVAFQGKWDLPFEGRNSKKYN